MTDKKAFADVYPLTPTQQGMLYHCLESGDASLYVSQFSLTLEGHYQHEPACQAWQSLVARHTVLRTAFVWKNQKQPLQVVGHNANLSIQFDDCSHLTESELKAHIHNTKLLDAAQGFELNKAGLLRFHCFKQNAHQFHCFLTIHHLILDGWSLNILMQEWLYEYHRLGLDDAKQTAALPDAKPFRQYIAWQKQQNQDQAMAYWKKLLAGFDTANSLALAKPEKQDSIEQEQQQKHASYGLELSESLTQSLCIAAQKHRYTLSTLIQAAWVICLQSISRQDDICFGLTRSGRPPQLTDVDRRMGMFITTLPIRIHA